MLGWLGWKFEDVVDYCLLKDGVLEQLVEWQVFGWLLLPFLVLAALPLKPLR